MSQTLDKLAARKRQSEAARKSRRMTRSLVDRVFRSIAITAASLSVMLLMALVATILFWGLKSLTPTFFTGVPDGNPKLAGIKPALFGTIYTCLVCAAFAIPIGVGTAIFLEEYKPRSTFAKRAHAFIQLNITNLAGVPSIVYGLLGLTVFANMFGVFGSPLSPKVELNARYYDQFVTSVGTTLLVPVPDRSAKSTVPTASTTFLSQQEQPIVESVAVVEDLATQLDAVNKRFDELARSLVQQVADGKPVDADLIRAAWSGAGFTTDLTMIEPSAIDPAIVGLSMKGRAARKAVEAALQPALRAELTKRFGLAIDLKSEPNRVTLGRESAGYLRLPFGPSVLAGGLTLMLVILPIVIISSQESLRAVPGSLRQASLAMGATRWQTIWRVTLPSATPGIMTGVILAMSRAIGEAAPILILSGIVFITFTPRNLMDQFTAMPLQIYNWASRPQDEFFTIAAGGIIVLMFILLCFNGVAIYIRQKTTRNG
jgi:phosphate transport system permease protein